jgi:predicted CoA-binding protein
MSSATSLRQIDAFLALKRIAVVGVSREPREFSTVLWQELLQRRYEAIPVNPAAQQIDGHRCYASVREIQPPVDGALIMVPPTAAERVIDDCAAVGVKHVWLYQGIQKPGAVSEASIDAAERNGMEVVVGHCPYMFLPGTPFFHALHALGKKLTGGYPRAA